MPALATDDLEGALPEAGAGPALARAGRPALVLDGERQRYLQLTAPAGDGRAAG